MLKIERTWAMPNKWTFRILPIEQLLRMEMNGGLWIDPFCGKSKIAQINNDINPNMPADFHLAATEFLKRFNDESVDGVLYDPPYSGEQIKRSYENAGLETLNKGNITQSSFWSRPKDQIARILKPGGKVISFGWNSSGLGKTRGFTKNRILLICHGSAHPDTIVVVETKIQTRLSMVI
jgi:hypothetical protein